MLKLPKIDEEDHPLKKQYRQTVLSKFAQFKSQVKDKGSKFDWVRCQINFVKIISKEAILREMIQFQIVCKKKEIPLFYSYFLMNSLFLNKGLKVARPEKPKSSDQKERKRQVHAEAPLNQVEIFIVQSLQQQIKKIQEDKSSFHKILNYVTLRQDLLKQIEKLSKQQIQNLVHEHVEDLRFLNFQIVDLVRAWKKEHKEIQEKSFLDSNTDFVPFDYVQPIFFRNDQNYLNKMVYDNAVIINTANQRKLSNFISLPNPFFLSQDGNIQLMGQKLKQNIESAMEFFAEQKANQLKLLLEQPEYVFKGKSLKDKITSFRLNTEKTLNAKSESIKKIYGPAGKYQASLKTNGFNFNEVVEQNPQERKKYSSLYAKKQQNQALTAYHAITSKLRQQAEILQESRAKFERIVKKSQVQLIKNLSRKQTRLKQQFHMLKQKTKLDQVKLFVDPYKQKISSLRRQVEKNVTSKKIPKEQSIAISQQAFLLTEGSHSTKNPLQKLAASKSKIKLIAERQINHQAINLKPNSFLIKKTTAKQDQTKTDHNNTKNQITRKDSFPIHFGRSQDKLQKTILKQRLSSTGKLKQNVAKSPQKIEERKESVRQQTIEQMKQDILRKIPQHRTNHPQVRNQRQSGYFLYKPQKLSKQLEYYLNLKPKTITPEIINFNESRSGQNNGDNQRNIDMEIKNLKQRLRDMEIMKIYGPKQSNPARKHLQNNYIGPREENKEQKLKDNSRREQRKERVKLQQTAKQQTSEKEEIDGQQVRQAEVKSNTSPMNRNRLSVIQRETTVLEKRIQKLLKKKQQSKPLRRANLSIQQEVKRVQRSPQGKNERSTDKQVREKLGESKQLLEEKLQKLKKKQELMQQGNQMTKKEIESSKKTKQQISSELQMKDKRLNQLQQRISEMKKKKESIVQQTEEKLNESVLDQKLQYTITQEAASIRTLRMKQSTMKKQNKNLQQQMKVQEEKFIQLKQAEYKIREEVNNKKHLESIEEIKSQYLSKQRQYEDKILDEEKQRKEQQIQLIIEKRQAEELKMKLLEQTMKQLLLKEILQYQQERHARYEQQADQYESEVRRKIEHQIREKEEFESRLADNFQQENVKMLAMINQIKEKNKKLEQANRKKIQQVHRTILEKENQTKKLNLLQMEVEKIEEEEELQKKIIQSPQKIKENYNIMQENQENDLLNTSPEQIPEEKIILFSEDQEGMEVLKLKVRKEILKQMQQRRKIEEQEEKKFEEERKKRLKILKDQIKEFMRKEGEIVRKIEEGKFDQVNYEIAQLKGRDQRFLNSPQEKQQSVVLNRQNSRQYKNSFPQVQSTLSMVQIYNHTVNSQNEQSQDEVEHRHRIQHRVQINQQSQKPIIENEQLSFKKAQKSQLSQEQQQEISKEEKSQVQKEEKSQKEEKPQLSKEQMLKISQQKKLQNQEKPQKEEKPHPQTQKKQDMKVPSAELHKKIVQVDKLKQLSFQEKNTVSEVFVKKQNRKLGKIIENKEIQIFSGKLYVKKGQEKLNRQEIRDQGLIGTSMKKQSDEKQKQQSELEQKIAAKYIINNQIQNLHVNNVNKQPQISKIEQKKQQVNKEQSQKIVNGQSPPSNHNKTNNLAVEVPIKKTPSQSEQLIKFSSQQNSIQKIEKSPVFKEKEIEKAQSSKVHIPQKIQDKTHNNQLHQAVLKNLQQDKNSVQQKQHQANNVKPAMQLMNQQKQIKSAQNLTNKKNVQQSSQINKKKIETTSVQQEFKQLKKQLPSLVQQKKLTQTNQLYPIPEQLKKSLHNQSPEILTHRTSKILDNSEQNQTQKIKKQVAKDQKISRAKELNIFQVPQEDYHLQKQKEKLIKAQNITTEHMEIKSELKQKNQEHFEQNEKPQQSKVSQIQITKSEGQPKRKNEGYESSSASIKGAEKITNKIAQKSQESLEKKNQNHLTIPERQHLVSEEKIKESAPNKTLQNQSPKTILISSKKRKQSQSQNDFQNREDQNKSIKSAVKRSNEQVFQKYQALQPFLNMKAKFVLIEEHQLKSFVAKFYSTLPQEVGEMLPYSQRELEIILRKNHRQGNKIDLFDCNSIGWYEQQKNKYVLLGQIQCVHLIVQKYGQIQIELAYVLNKANLQQKQYLAKKLKFFAQIGYVYQKRMADQTLFSVKVILKIPKQIVPKEFIKPNQLVTFSSQITLLKSSLPKKSLQKEGELQMKHNIVFWHLLGDCISNDLPKEKLEQLLVNNMDQSLDLKFFIRTIQSSQSEQNIKKLVPFISHQHGLTSEFQISFDLPSIQLGSKMFLSLLTKEFTLKNGQKFYLGSDEKELDKNKSKSMWKFLIFEADKSILKKNYLETYLTTKVEEINASKSERELNLMVPGFVIKSTLKLREEEDFKQNLIHRSSIRCNLLSSSISRSDSIADQETKIITLSQENPENGFVFCLCYCPEKKVVKVMAGSWIGFQDQTIYDQLFAETKK